jgi:ketosteroid isomerase-like protein
VTLLETLNLRDLASANELFSPNVVWHYVNPNLPDMEGAYEGLEGIRDFFGRLGEKSAGTFWTCPVLIPHPVLV